MAIVEQGSAEWHQARLGKLTASRLADALARTKSGWGASRANYMADLVAERQTGVPTAGYVNEAMKWGIETEPRAKAAYEWHMDAAVDPCGFIPHPTIEMSGASPDGLIENGEGVLELKCPNSATHIQTLLGGVLPQRYLYQVQWQMACAQASYCDWVSFDPRMALRKQLFVLRVKRNDTMIEKLEADVIEFLGELDRTCDDLDRLYPEGA